MQQGTRRLKFDHGTGLLFHKLCCFYKKEISKEFIDARIGKQIDLYNCTKFKWF